MLVRTRNGTVKEIIYNGTQLYQYGINRLGEREYLRQELFTKMRRLQPDAQIVNEVLDKLTAQRYLDEHRAIDMVLNRYAGKEAISKTKRRLAQKGADAEILTQCIEQRTTSCAQNTNEHDIPPQQHEAYTLLCKRFPTYDASKYDKMLRFLLSKGYSYSDVKVALALLKSEEANLS